MPWWGWAIVGLVSVIALGVIGFIAYVVWGMQREQPTDIWRGKSPNQDREI